MSYPVGSTARVMVTGSYGAFAGMGSKGAITQGLNAIGMSVLNWTSNDPSFVSQVLDGNFVSTDYQETLDVTLGQNYDSAVAIAGDVGNVFQDVLGTPPTAVACTMVNGIPTGNDQNANSYGVTNVTTAVQGAATSVASGIGDAASSGFNALTKPIQDLINGTKDEFNSTLTKVETLLIVAAVGIVLIVIFSPSFAKSAIPRL